MDTHMPLSGKSGTKAISRLVVLPWGKSLEISYRSLRVRFSRSLITTLSLLLAVAFLGFVSVSTDIANGLLSTGDQDLWQALVRAGYDLSPADTSAGSTPKQQWLVVLSPVGLRGRHRQRPTHGRDRAFS